MRITPHLCMVVSFLRQLTPERLKGNRGLPETHLLARHAFGTQGSFGTRRTMLTDERAASSISMDRNYRHRGQRPVQLHLGELSQTFCMLRRSTNEESQVSVIAVLRCGRSDVLRSVTEGFRR